MTKNKLFIEAIANRNLQLILKQIRDSNGADTFALNLLLNRARSFTRAKNLDFTPEQILAEVQAARGEELEIIRGEYQGEIPVDRSYKKGLKSL